MTCIGCRIASSDTRIKVEEGRRKAVFLNSKRSTFHRTRVDGCLVKHQISADYVVSCVDVGDVIVELKGKDVVHAVEQVVATANFMRSCSKTRGPIAGLVVCAQYPRIDTTIQRMMSKFKKGFNAPLHVVTKNYEFQIGKVLSFDGPL